MSVLRADRAGLETPGILEFQTCNSESGMNDDSAVPSDAASGIPGKKEPSAAMQAAVREQADRQLTAFYFSLVIGALVFCVFSVIYSEDLAWTFFSGPEYGSRDSKLAYVQSSIR